MENKLTGDALKAEIERLRDLFPFEVAQGDAIHRLNPPSRQVLNTNTSWLVSQEGRAAHKLKSDAENLNNLVQIIDALQQQLAAKDRVIERAKQGLEFYADIKKSMYDKGEVAKKALAEIDAKGEEVVDTTLTVNQPPTGNAGSIPAFPTNNNTKKENEGEV